MNDRIHDVLDGFLDRSELTGDELAELQQAESMISGTLGAIAERKLPDLAPGVMQRIAALSGEPEKRPRPTARLLEWIWQPRAVTLRWRPATVFAGVAMVALLVWPLAARWMSGRGGGEPVLVEFRLEAPQAAQVSLAGDFTAWRPDYRLKPAGGGVWTIVVPLQPGVHDYAFIVDGDRWVADPAAPTVDDGFGGLNSRLAVLPNEERS